MLKLLRPFHFLSPESDFGGGAGGATAVADDSSASAGGDDGGGAGFGGGEHEGGATSAPSPSEGKPSDSGTAADAAAEQGRSEHTNFMRQAIARAKGQPAPAAPGGATPVQPGQPGQGPAAPPAAPATPTSLRVLSLTDADWQGVDPAQRAALEPILTAKLAELEQQRYLPVARQVHADHQQNMEYFAQVQQVMGSEPYQLAEWLAANPDKYQAVVAMLRGETPPAGAPALPNIDPASLDPETRAIYAHAQAAQAEVQQLRQQLADTLGQIDQRVGQFDEFRQTQIAREQAAANSFVEKEAAWHLSEAHAHAAKVLGFDPTKYTDLITKAYDDIRKMMASNVCHVDDFKETLVKVLKFHGAGEIAQRLKAQRDGGVPPPADRAAGGETSHAAFMRDAIATAKRERYGT